jgi:hypothetical protein
MPKNHWMAFVIAVSVTHAACAEFVTGTFAQRVMLYVPFALLGLGIASSRLSSGFQTLVLTVAALLGAIQFAGMGIYATLPGDRSPDRFASLPLEVGASVAGTTEMWYHFVSRRVPFRIITRENALYANYWLQREHLSEFDTIILPSGDEMLRWPELSRWRKVDFEDFTGRLVVCLKEPVGVFGKLATASTVVAF